MFGNTSNGKEKNMNPDGLIDLGNFFIRNSTSSYGHMPRGSGNANTHFPSTELKIGSKYYLFNNTTYQCEGSGNFAQYKKSIVTHEIAHLFLGSNEMHTSNREGHDGGTFLGFQGGHALFGGGLLTCNAYERWRIGWKNEITANNVNSDILAQFPNEQTFILRDFVTYGDAIRIKLPYKDKTTSLNQYIWLENHQVDKNNKTDGYAFNNVSECRKVNQAGIYAYYQIGKDILEGNIYSNVYPSNQSDNLKMISAEGNYNVTYLNNEEDCFGWSGTSGFPKFEYKNQNIFYGFCNQTAVLTFDTLKTYLSYPDNFKFMGSKIKNNIHYNNLPWIGTNFDAFVPNPEIKIDISTNPAAVNTLTYYLNISNNALSRKTNAASSSTRKTHLTGLSIRMIDESPGNTGMKSYAVKIRWDDYDVKQNVNWNGEIVLREQLNLLGNRTITLDKNRTPIQINKDSISGFFSKTTSFTCENNSRFTLQENSSVKLTEKSSFILDADSYLTVLDGAVIEVNEGSTLVIKSDANLTLSAGGKIVVKTGGYLCVEQGADINLQDYNSVIVLEEGAVLGADPQLFPTASCASAISKKGNESIADYSQDVYIQNETISADRYIAGRNIFVGNNVTTNKPSGNVLINNGSNVIFDCKGIVLDAGFECASGASFEVKNH